MLILYTFIKILSNIVYWWSSFRWHSCKLVLQYFANKFTKLEQAPLSNRNIWLICSNRSIIFNENVYRSGTYTGTDYLLSHHHWTIFINRWTVALYRRKSKFLNAICIIMGKAECLNENIICPVDRLYLYLFIYSFIQTMLCHCILLHYFLKLQCIGYSFVPPVHSIKYMPSRGFFGLLEFYLKLLYLYLFSQNCLHLTFQPYLNSETYSRKLVQCHRTLGQA